MLLDELERDLMLMQHGVLLDCKIMAVFVLGGWREGGHPRPRRGWRVSGGGEVSSGSFQHLSNASLPRGITSLPLIGPVREKMRGKDAQSSPTLGIGGLPLATLNRAGGPRGWK